MYNSKTKTYKISAGLNCNVLFCVLVNYFFICLIRYVAPIECLNLKNVY